MAWGLENELRAARQSSEAWLRQRNRDLQHGVAELEARGRQVVHDSIRTGQQIKAGTSAELRELGLAATQGRLPEVILRQSSAIAATAASRRPTAKSTQVSSPATATSRDLYEKLRAMAAEKEQAARVGLSGAVDEFSFGAADHVSAGLQALMHGGDAGFIPQYRREMAEERASDAFDAEHHGLARNVGRAVGFAASLAATGGAPGLVGRAAAALPRAARLAALVAKAPKLRGVDPRGLATLAAGGGAGAAVVEQGVMDAASRHLSSPRDYIAMAVGGGLGGLETLHQGPMRGGAVEGATTSAVRDILDGRLPSAEEMLEAGRAGAVTAGLARVAGTYVAAALPRRAKGALGETMTRAKVLARGRWPRRTEDVVLSNGRIARPDVPVGDEFMEAKFGPYADLTTNQRRLRREQPDRFFVDAWQFGDVGKAAASIGAPFGVIPVETEADRRRDRRD